jgi:hypothetical protein
MFGSQDDLEQITSNKPRYHEAIYILIGLRTVSVNPPAYFATHYSSHTDLHIIAWTAQTQHNGTRSTVQREESVTRKSFPCKLVVTQY